MQAAWTAAALGRAKKMAPLKNFLLTPSVRPKATSWEAMYASAAAWAGERGIINTEGGGT